MKIKNIIVTFWFNKYNNIKELMEILGDELQEYFPAFNLINLPANVDSIIPRITAQSKSGHSTLNVSTINAQIITNYDENFNENIDNCLDYIEPRALKLFKGLSSKSVEVLYSAVFVNLEKEAENSIDTIKTNLLNPSISINNLSEIGMRMAMSVEQKFYRILTVNNSKDFTMQKQFSPGQNEIVFQLISLQNAKITKEYISLSYELNDKLSFDSNENYKDTQQNINKIFSIVKDDLSNNIEEFIDSGIIN